MIADVRLVLHMDRDNMPLQRLLFAEVLFAWRKSSTFTFLFLLVSFNVFSESLSGGKSLSTSLPRADPITFVLVRSLYVGLEVAFSQKGFIAIIVCTYERSLTSVGTLVFSEAYGAYECFTAIGKIAYIFLVTSRILRSRCTWLGCGGCCRFGGCLSRRRQ